MIRSLLALALVAGPAVAEPSATPKAPACKRVVVGRGLDRHVVCQFSAQVIVKASVPQPKVLIVHRDPRDVAGPPKSGDRLAGLSHHLN